MGPLVAGSVTEKTGLMLITGATGQVEVSWTFRGGMDLRDEVAGTHGTIWMNHFLRTGFEMFSAPGAGGGYVAEKAETSAGWDMRARNRRSSSAAWKCSRGPSS